MGNWNKYAQAAYSVKNIVSFWWRFCCACFVY